MFTVPVTGVWRVSFTLQSPSRRGVASLIQPSVYTGEWNYVYIYHNQQRIVETELYTYSEVKNVVSTGGRELITRAGRHIPPRYWEKGSWVFIFGFKIIY